MVSNIILAKPSYIQKVFPLIVDAMWLHCGRGAAAAGEAASSWLRDLAQGWGHSGRTVNANPVHLAATLYWPPSALSPQRNAAALHCMFEH
jgi:hypothetical protein